MMKRSTKYTIKKGKLVLNKPAKPKAKLTDYERYVNIARSNGLPKSEILNKNNYELNIASYRQRGVKLNPTILVRRQLQGGLSDKEFRARLNAARRIDPTMSRKKFIQTQGWESIDDYVSKRYEELKAIYHYDELKDKDKKLKTTIFARIISTEIYGSE